MGKRNKWWKKRGRSSPNAVLLAVVIGIAVVLARMGGLLTLLRGLGKTLEGAVKGVAGGTQAVGDQVAGGTQAVGDQVAGGTQAVGDQVAGGTQTNEG